MNSNKLRLYTASFIVYIFCSCLTAYAQTCSEALSLVSVVNPITEVTPLDIERMPYDSSVEAEIELTEGLAKILTTTDGTVGGLFVPNSKGNHGAMMPPWFTKYAKYKKLTLRPEKLKWSKLPYPIQKRLLLSPNNHILINNLRVKKELKLNFKEPTELFGNIYPVGTHNVNTDFFADYIYLESETKNRALLELHLRTNLPAGINSNDAYKFFELIGLNLTHQHIHIVGPKPDFTNKLISYKTLDSFFRANLLTELMHCLLYTSPSPRDATLSRMPSSA